MTDSSTTSALEVLICEVGPRDGLQNDQVILEPARRAELCQWLADAGLARIEAVSFVHPKLVPAMAGPEQVLESLGVHTAWSADDHDGAGAGRPWSGLILNERGFNRAVAAGVGRINLTVAVTESFCQRNQGCSRAEAEALLGVIARRAVESGVTLTATLAVSFGCPFEGRVDPGDTLALAAIAADAGIAEIVLADTIGVATPRAVRALISQVKRLGVRVGGHFHDTRNTGIANCLAALDAGAVLLDASVGGIGGCPFAPGATGNVATEDLLYVLSEEGVETGVEPTAVIAVARRLEELLGRGLSGAVSRAGLFPEPVVQPRPPAAAAMTAGN